MGSSPKYNLEGINRREALVIGGQATALGLLLMACGELPGGSSRGGSGHSYISRFREVTLLEGYKGASGLSAYGGGGSVSGLQRALNSQTAANSDGSVVGAFTVSPRFSYDELFNSRSFSNFPKIIKYKGNIDDLIAGNPFSESSVHIYDTADPNDFNTFLYGDINPFSQDFLPRGLNLDTLVIGDSVLLSSNVSRRIIQMDPFGNFSTYLEDDRLIGISNMILGSDGKIYAVRLPLVSGSSVERSKDIISIDINNGKVIGDVCNVTSDFYGINRRDLSVIDPSNVLYAGLSMIFDEQLKIAENSPTGKSNNGNAFYVSDMLGKRVYVVDSSNVAGVLKDGLRFPVAIVVDSSGNVYPQVSPLLGVNDNSFVDITQEDANGVVSAPDLMLIDPAAPLTDSRAYRYPVDSYRSGYYSNVSFKGVNYALPGAFTTDAAIFENATDLAIQSTDSLTGEVKLVTATKA